MVPAAQQALDLTERWLRDPNPDTQALCDTAHHAYMATPSAPADRAYHLSYAALAMSYAAVHDHGAYPYANAYLAFALSLTPEPRQ